MSDSISLSVDYTTSNRKSASRTITNVKPSATDSELNSFVNDLYNLTSNSVGTVTRIAKRKIDEVVPPTNPIVAVQSEDNAIYTVTGSGTEYNITVILSAFQNIDDPLFDEKMVKVTLQDGVYGSIYNGRYQASCEANLDNTPNDSGWIGALVWLGSEGDGVGQDSVVFACPVAWNKGNISANTINNVKVTFPETTVGTTTYAAWSLTFTFN